MRLMLILLAILCFGKKVQALDETWLTAQNPENASYLAPKMKVSSLNDTLVFWPGARLGWIVGSVVSLGFEGYVLANNISSEGPDTSPFSMAVGGVVLEAIPYSERRTHLAFSLLMGAGGSQVGGDIDLDSLSRHSFLIVEPGASVEFNLTRNIRLCPGMSYLWISGKVDGMDSKWKISETAYSLTLKFIKPD